jgi:hypothetical protein
MAGIVFGGVFAAMIAGFIAFVVGSDRKRALRRGRTERVGVGGATVPVVAHVSREATLRLAEEAVRRVGGQEIKTLNGSVVVGWIGSAWTNLPKRSEYELGVSLSVLPDGSTQFMCSGRPRFGSQLSGYGRNQTLARQLASEVTTLAEDQGTQ